MKRAVATLLAGLALAGCAGEREHDSRRTGTSSDTATVVTVATATGKAPPGGIGEAPARHVATRSALQRIRAIEERFSKVNERLEEGVRAVSGFDSEVRCWTRAGWRRLAAIQGAAPNEIAGVADIVSLDIHLHPLVCDWLEALLRGERPEAGFQARWMAISLVALTHEGMHLTAVGTNEKAAECRAMQKADEVAVRLGVEEDYARRLAGIYWEQVYRPDDPVYGSPECRDGGILDADPDTSVWP